MGAFIIIDISFKHKRDRNCFETKFPLFTPLVDNSSNSYGFMAWATRRNPFLDVVYNCGFLGYAEPKEILKTCGELGINIEFLAWLPINDRKAKWKEEGPKKIKTKRFKY